MIVAGKGETLDFVPRFLITADASPARRSAASRAGRRFRAVDRWLAGEFDAEALVTNRIPLDDVNEAFEAMERQEGIRTVITSFA